MPTGTAWRDVWGFLAFSHAWTWGFWIVSGRWGTTVWEAPALVFLVIGGAGVLLGGIVMTALIHGAAGLRSLGRRSRDPRRITARWWTVILLLFPALTLLAGAAAAVFGAVVAPLDFKGAYARAADPGGLVATLGFLLLIGPVPEEIGWRGYLLDRLQTRWTALTASLVLGALWWLWHLPLLFLPGYYDAFGAAAPDPLAFLASLLAASVL